MGGSVLIVGSIPYLVRGRDVIINHCQEQILQKITYNFFMCLDKYLVSTLGRNLRSNSPLESI